jgi:hypothetical protein
VPAHGTVQNVAQLMKTEALRKKKKIKKENEVPLAFQWMVER